METMGVLDFAGGIVIHTSAGISALVLAHLIGRRYDSCCVLPFHPPLGSPWLVTSRMFGFNRLTKHFCVVLKFIHPELVLSAIMVRCALPIYH
jgi:ammonia channel protein AmtB